MVMRLDWFSIIIRIIIRAMEKRCFRATIFYFSLFFFFFFSAHPVCAQLTRWCAMPFRGRPRIGFAPGYNRSTRAKRRTWPWSGNRSDFYARFRIDRCTMVCSGRSRRRRTSEERSAASVRPGFHLSGNYTRNYTRCEVESIRFS